MMMKMKIRMLMDRILNLFKKKGKVSKIQHPLYAQRKTEPIKPKEKVVIAFLLAVLSECRVVVWEDLKWLMNLRKPQPADRAWSDAVDRMRKELR